MFMPASYRSRTAQRQPRALCVRRGFALMSRALPPGVMFMSRLRLSTLLLLGLLSAGALLSGGCGNKGPLYLPDNTDKQK